jgi:hypothetical protein
MPSLLDPIVAGSPDAVPERLQRYSRYVLLLSGSELDGNDVADESEGTDEETEEDEEERERWSLIQDGALRAAHSMRHPFFRAGSYRATGTSETKVDLRF